MEKSLQQPGSKNWGISWPLIAWIAGLATLFTGNNMLQDPDTYWHTAVGNWILDHRAIPHVDYFSHSMPNVAWTAHEWLSEIVFALIHGVAGWSGLVILTALCFATTLAVLTRYLLRHLEPVHALILVALSAGMLRSHLLARPHMLAVPLLALWIFGLLGARECKSPPSLWLLPIIILWANLHGSFTLGLGLAFALGVEAVMQAEKSQRIKEARQWGIFISLALACAMITPFHWEGVTFSRHVMGLEKMLAIVGEWQSPNFQTFLVFELWLLAFLGLALSGRIRLPAIRLLIILGLTHLSLKHGRYMAVTGIVAPFLIAEGFARNWYTAPKLGRDASTLDRWFAALTPPAGKLTIAFVTMGSMLIFSQMISASKFQPDNKITPSGALAAIRKANINGPIFNQYGFGGYLIYSGVPVFIDGRADMYGDEFLERYVNSTSLKSVTQLQELLQKYDIAATMLAPDAPAVAILDYLPGWEKIYADDIAVAHVKTSGKEPR